MTFLVTAAAFGALALVTNNHEGEFLGWLGVCVAFLTAGLIDLVALLEARRRATEVERSLAPVRTTIDHYLLRQRQALLNSVQVMFQVDGDPATWPALLRATNAPVDPFAPAKVLPPQTVAQRIGAISIEVRSRQEHLEALSAGGLRTEAVTAMSAVATRGEWPLIIDMIAGAPTLAAIPSSISDTAKRPTRGLAEPAAKMVEALLEIDLRQPN